jgi:integrase
MTRKRGQNEGSIFQRKDGRWVAQVTIGGRVQQKYFRNQRDCRSWLKATNSKVKMESKYEGTLVTLSEYLDIWLESVKISLRPKTFVQYDQIVHQYIIPATGADEIE